MPDEVLLTLPEQMIDDLSAVALLPDECIQRLTQRLEQQTGFLTDDRLRSLASEFVKDDSQATGVFHVLQNLPPGAIEQVLEAVQKWRHAHVQNADRFPEDLYTALEQKLRMLVPPHSALNRMWKAKRLRTMLGNELEGVAFICDARPVYNKSRDRIEGMIALTTMKLVYERQNLSIEEIEITVTPTQLRELISEAEKAEKKLATLRESIAEWIPDGFAEAQE